MYQKLSHQWQALSVKQDFNKFPKYCDLFLETVNGGNCFMTVECKEGGKLLYKQNYAGWDQCKVGGMTYFHDPRLGHLGYVLLRR